MSDLFISGINQKLLDRFTNRLNKLRTGGAKKGDKSKYAIQAIEQWLNTTPEDLQTIQRERSNRLIRHYRADKLSLAINRTDAQEVYELLCTIPFDIAMSQDSEPPNKRHPAIENMIKQLEDYLKEK